MRERYSSKHLSPTAPLYSPCLNSFCTWCKILMAAQDPIVLKGHRWGACFPRVSEPLPGHCLFDPSSGLGVCGDWCAAASAEGAFLSGSSLANAILKLHEKGSKM
mmetsp:Transcript_47666/g.123600  ORF Transcript_47666/g.123600 Transcript_47666/m.123600 type:complete len:105 (+) Transcript_47666:817-1131(+)